MSQTETRDQTFKIANPIKDQVFMTSLQKGGEEVFKFVTRIILIYTTDLLLILANGGGAG